MYAVVRNYPGSSQLFDLLESKKEDVERVIRGVSGLISYTLMRSADGGVSVTVCQDKAGVDESVRIAAEWVRENFTGTSNPPAISEGETILQLSP